MDYLPVFDTIKTTFKPSYEYKPHLYSVMGPLRQFSKLKRYVILSYDVILAQKFRHFDNFPPKMGYF